MFQDLSEPVRRLPGRRPCSEILGREGGARCVVDVAVDVLRLDVEVPFGSRLMVTEDVAVLIQAPDIAGCLDEGAQLIILDLDAPAFPGFAGKIEDDVQITLRGFIVLHRHVANRIVVRP